MIEAASCVIRDRDDRLLLLHKHKPDSVRSQDFWEPPGGKSEPGETSARTALREGGEELGVVVWVEPEPLLVAEITLGEKLYQYSYFQAGIANNNAPMVTEPVHVDMRYLDRAELERLRRENRLSKVVLTLLDSGVLWLPRTA